MHCNSFFLHTLELRSKVLSFEKTKKMRIFFGFLLTYSYLCTRLSPDGGIGRRAGLKHQWGNPSRFEPGSGYSEGRIFPVRPSI